MRYTRPQQGQGGTRFTVVACYTTTLERGGGITSGRGIKSVCLEQKARRFGHVDSAATDWDAVPVTNAKRFSSQELLKYNCCGTMFSGRPPSRRYVRLDQHQKQQQTRLNIFGQNPLLPLESRATLPSPNIYSSSISTSTRRQSMYRAGLDTCVPIMVISPSADGKTAGKKGRGKLTAPTAVPTGTCVCRVLDVVESTGRFTACQPPPTIKSRPKPGPNIKARHRTGHGHRQYSIGSVIGTSAYYCCISMASQIPPPTTMVAKYDTNNGLYSSQDSYGEQL